MGEFVGDPGAEVLHRRRSKARRFVGEFGEWPQDILEGHEHKFRQIGFDLADEECREKLEMLLWVCVQEAQQTMMYGGLPEDALIEVFLTGEIESLAGNQTYVFRRSDPLAQYGIGRECLGMLGVSLDHKIRVSIQRDTLVDVWGEISVGQSIYQDLHAKFGFRPLQRAEVFRGRSGAGKTGQGGEETFLLALDCWNIAFCQPEWLSVHELPSQSGVRRLSILRVPLRVLIEEHSERYSYEWFSSRGLSQALVNSLEVVFCGNRLEGVVRDEKMFRELVASIRGQQGKSKKKNR